MKQTRKMWAKVTFQFSGVHHWKDAPLNVEYLRNSHRHVFHVTVFVEQFHSDRDVEYLTLKRQLEREYLAFMDWGPTSCEGVAFKILDLVRTICRKQFSFSKERDIKVEVLEDGENGSVVEEVVE